MEAPIQYAKDNCNKNFALSYFPILTWAPKYNLRKLQSDFIAGITIGLMVIPQGLAYAKVAELPAEYGLYSSFMGCFIYCIFGTSKDITLGPTAIMSLMTAQFNKAPGEEPKSAVYAIILCLMCGLVHLLMGICKLGILVNFISHPVVSAFTTAAALIIGWGQVKSLLGLHHIPRDFIPSILKTFENIEKLNPYDLTIGLICIILLIVMKLLTNIKWPAEPSGRVQSSARYFVWLVGTARNAVVVVAAALVAYALQSQNIFVLSMTPHVPAGLPIFSAPKFELFNGTELLRNAGEIFGDIGIGFVIVPLIGLVETIAIGSAFARKNNYRIDPNQELIALGFSNIFGSFISSFPAVGSFSRTAVNSQSGVKTPAGGIWTGILLILSLAFMTQYFEYVPSASLAGVIIVAVLQMTDFTTLLHIWKIKRIDTIQWIATFVVSLGLGIDLGIVAGIAVSFGTLLYSMARPALFIDQCPSGPVVKPTSGFRFPAVSYIQDAVSNVQQGIVLADPDSQCVRPVLLDLSDCSAMDYSAAHGLVDLDRTLVSKYRKLVVIAPQQIFQDRLRSTGHEFTIFDSITSATESIGVTENSHLLLSTTLGRT